MIISSPLRLRLAAVWAFFALSSGSPVFVSVSLAAEPLTAETADPETADPWLAKRGAATVSRRDFEDFLLAEVKPEHRPGFMASDRRVSEVMEGLLMNRQVEIEADAAGIERQPEVQAKLRRARQRVIVQAWLEQYGFDHARGDYEQLARERYLANPAAFDLPEAVDVSHILISTRERDDAAALELAGEIEGRIRSGDLSFAEAVRQYSEDPSAVSNLGRFPEVRRGMMVAPFEEAAFALPEPGAMTGPVQTQYGYHLIRLNGKTAAGRRTFDDVKASLIETVALERRAAARDEYERQLRNKPQEANEEAIQALIDKYFPPEAREALRQAGKNPDKTG